MKLTELLKELGIGKWSACWAFLVDGWAGCARLVCEAFTKLLKRANADKLKSYSELAENIGKFIAYGIELFVPGGAARDAGITTANAVSELSRHMADGNYTTEELNADILNIEYCINEWKKVVA